ncbi:hypothetical protein SVIOM342S_02969 [Streptomyces violaceorubidus]
MSVGPGPGSGSGPFRREPAPARRDGLAVLVQEPRAQRGQHPGAAVRGGAAADPEHDGPRPRVQRGPQQLARAVRGRRQRCEDTVREPLEAAGLRHLHHSGVLAQRVRRRHLVAEGTGDPYLPALEPGRDRGGHRAVAAVGDGQRLDQDVRHDAAQSCRDALGDLDGRQRALELVRGDEYPTGPVHSSVSHLALPLLSEPCARQGSRAAATLTGGRPCRHALPTPWNRPRARPASPPGPGAGSLRFRDDHC